MASREPSQLLWEAAGQTYHLTFDVYKNESYKFSTEVTQHPIETGSPVADHAFDVPTEVTFKGIVSKSPCLIPPDYNQGAQGFTKKVEVLGQQKTIADYANSVPSQVSLLPGVPAGIPIAGRLVTGIAVGPYDKTYLYFPDVSQEGRPRIVANLLMGLKEAKQLFTYKSDVFTLTSMLIKDVTVDKLAGRLEFNVTLQQVQQSSVALVEEPAIKIKAKQQGPKSPKKADPVPEQAESAAHKAVDFVKKFFQ